MEVTFYHNDKNLHYRTEGEGMAIMFIHGFAEDRTIWEELAKELAGRFRLLIPDLPGSGVSELTTNLSIDSMAEACKAILDKEQVTECVLIGHSMGGYVSLAIAEKYPEVVAALGLFHSSAFADDDEKKETRRKNIGFIFSHGTQPFLNQATPTLFSEHSRNTHPEMVKFLINKYSDFEAESLMAYQQAMIERPDRRDVLENIVKPVLFIIGKEDKAIPYDLSLKQSHLPATAYVHVLEQTGHMGMMEEFEESLDILEEFLFDLQRLQQNDGQPVT